jgi:hypothetical protein
MSQIHPEVNLVFQPVAGVANWGSGNHSTAALHFAGQRLVLGKQLHAPVLPPIVPSNFGIFGSTRTMSRNFEKHLYQELANYPNALVFFVAHSFGTLLCRESVLRSPELRDRHAGTIALGAPLLGVEEGRWKGFEKTEKNINAFAADIRAGHEDEGNHAALGMIATTLDVMVTPQSALPAIEGKARHLFGSADPSLSGVTTHRNVGIDHNLLVAHPQAIWLTAQLARQMVKEQSSFGAVPELAQATS